MNFTPAGKDVDIPGTEEFVVTPPDNTLRVYAHEIKETVPPAKEKLYILFRGSHEGNDLDEGGNNDLTPAHSSRI